MHILLRMLIPHGGEPPCHLQIDKLPDGCYRATAGPLPEAHELCRTPDLEALFRQADRLSACRSFREVLTALQQLSELDDGRATPQPQAARRGGGGDRPAVLASKTPAGKPPDAVALTWPGKSFSGAAGSALRRYLKPTSPPFS